MFDEQMKKNQGGIGAQKSVPLLVLCPEQTPPMSGREASVVWPLPRVCAEVHQCPGGQLHRG